MNPWEEVLTAADLVETAKAEFARSRGGSNFVAGELLCIEGCLGNAWTAEGYVDDPEVVRGFVFGCALLVALIRGHCLTDGNKRIGWCALTLVLTSLGLDLEATTEEVEALCMKIVKGPLERQGVAAWLQLRLRPVQVDGGSR